MDTDSRRSFYQQPYLEEEEEEEEEEEQVAEACSADQGSAAGALSSHPGTPGAAAHAELARLQSSTALLSTRETDKAAQLSEERCANQTACPPGRAAGRRCPPSGHGARRCRPPWRTRWPPPRAPAHCRPPALLCSLRSFSKWKDSRHHHAEERLRGGLQYVMGHATAEYVASSITGLSWSATSLVRSTATRRAAQCSHA